MNAFNFAFFVGLRSYSCLTLCSMHLLCVCEAYECYGVERGKAGRYLYENDHTKTVLLQRLKLKKWVLKRFV